MKIAVIGAGLAGLTAASRLAAAGYDVDLLEKSRGVGGRMSTRRETWASLDLGASYFTARSPEFRAQVARWLRAGTVARWTFSPHRAAGGALQHSPDEIRRYVGLPRMNEPLRPLGHGASLYTGALVESIERRRDGWHLHTTAPVRTTAYDWVICSMPAEQSLRLLRGNPLGTLIPADMHTPCWAVALGTSGRIDETIQGIFGDEVVSWAARQSSKPGRSVNADCDDAWVLHFSPQWSREHGKETAIDPAAVAADWLQNRLGTALEVRYRYRHYWRYAKVADRGLETPYLIDPEQRLAVVGAWCLDGRVEGAYRSGLALAERLSATYGRNPATRDLHPEDEQA